MDSRFAKVFYFGSTEDNARSYVDLVTSHKRWPQAADKHPDEMDLHELRIWLVVGRAALKAARISKAPDEVMEVLVEWYDHIFEATMEHCPILQTIHIGKKEGVRAHVLPVNHTKENLEKYRAIQAKYAPSREDL